MESTEQYTSGGGAGSPETQQAAVESTTTQDAGTVNPESQSAAVEGVTEGQEQTQEQTQTQEDAENATEEKKGHQKTLEERAEEIADKKIQQRLAEAEERRQAEAVAQPDFIPVDYAAYDNHIARLYVQERQLTDELALDPDNPQEVVRQIRAVQSERTSLETAFNANEAKRQAWTVKQQESQRQTEFNQAIQAEIVQTVENMAKNRGATPELLEAGRAKANELMKSDPALQKRFDDIITHKATFQGFSGVDAAVEFIWGHTTEVMSKAAESTRNKKETGKQTTVAGGGEASGDFANVHNFKDLMALPSAKINQFANAHPKRFEELKKKHFK